VLRVTEATGLDPSAGRSAPAIYRLMNPVMRAVLRSRFHRLLSGQLMVLSYTGRTSGRSYTIPIGYFAWDGGSVLAFSGSRWWLNLRDGRHVTLLIAGVPCEAVPTVVEPIDARVDLLAAFVHRYGPKVAARLQVGLPSDRDSTLDELRSAAAKKMLIRFDPDVEESIRATP